MRKNNASLALSPLASGSKGNSYWLEFGDTCALIDCGISHRQLNLRTQQIGRSLEQVDHIFISHEHSDHVKGLAVMLKKHHPVIWATRGTLRSIRHLIPDGSSVRMLENKDEIAGDFRVKAIPVEHDAAQPCGFHFETDGGSAAMVTDLGKWNQMIIDAIGGSELLIYESNHDPDMLRRGPYPPMLKMRIASPLGHLSNYDGADLAYRSMMDGTKKAILGHLSETNNTKMLALEAIQELLDDDSLDTEIIVASQGAPGPWVEL